MQGESQTSSASPITRSHNATARSMASFGRRRNPRDTPVQRNPDILGGTQAPCSSSCYDKPHPNPRTPLQLLLVAAPGPLTRCHHPPQPFPIPPPKTLTHEEIRPARAESALPLWQPAPLCHLLCPIPLRGHPATGRRNIDASPLRRLLSWQRRIPPRHLAPGPSPRGSGPQCQSRAKWLGLKVLRHTPVDADHAEVEFVARYRVQGRAQRLHRDQPVPARIRAVALRRRRSSRRSALSLRAPRL